MFCASIFLTMSTAMFLWLAAIVKISMAGCPFNQAIQNGQFRANIIEESKKQLISAQFLLTSDQPANLMWSTDPQNHEQVDLFNRSNALVMAKQFYIQQYMVDNPDVELTPALRADLLRQATECIPMSARCTEKPSCDVNSKYATTSGKCNNLQYPKWGAAGSAYSRLIAPVYDDAIYTIRMSVTNSVLPSPRRIGNELNQHSVYTYSPSQPMPNYAFLMVGQLLAHDVGHIDVYQNSMGGPGLNCCPPDGKGMLPKQLTYYGCDPIEIPADDPFYKNSGRSCMSFMRSQPVLANDCTIDTTDFSNFVSHFVDLSVIYGSSDAVAQSVRTFDGGRLIIENGVAAILPGCSDEFCYFTGDNRAMINPRLGLLHSVLLRFHNWIVEQLAVINPHWADSDERLFQEARRITVANYQQMIFNEWLPLYVGRDVATRRNVTCTTGGYCGRYKSQIEPSCVSEFSMGAFRMLHGNIPELVNTYDKDFQLINSAKLSDSITGCRILETNFTSMARGLLKDAIYMGRYPDNIRNTIFNNGNKDGMGSDILGMDMKRGRDIGLSSYLIYLQRCTPGEEKIEQWSDLLSVMSPTSISALRRSYASVFDIDLMAGMLMEQKDGVYTGPVSQCIIEEQFYKFKYGNRFFYSLENNANPFTEDQINEINRQSFANILCTVSGLDEVFGRSFEVESPDNPRISCATLDPLDLNLWQE